MSKLIAQLGDVNPIEYGGYFVFDEGEGRVQGEKLIPPEDGEKKWTIYIFDLDKCTSIDGVLSDNEFHPDFPAWFADDISSVSSFIGQETPELIDYLCSDDPTKRAWAYQAIGDYHGYDNLDEYPLKLNKKEVRARYKEYGF